VKLNNKIIGGFIPPQQKERKMQTCYECGEDLILNSNHINECSNKNCETHTNKFDSFDKIQHLENQINLENQMND
tara:strand:+ start:174 stop:398 length:225 start_codon:yes stop_codon:yes gene_type:complete